MTNDLPNELRLARSLLTQLAPDPFVKERIYRNIVTRATLKKTQPWQWGVIVVGLVTAASAAYGLGLVVPPKALPPSVDERLTYQSMSPQMKQRTKVRRTVPSSTSTSTSTVESSITTGASPHPTSIPLTVSPLPSKSQAIPRRQSANDEDAELGLQVLEYREAVAQLGASPTDALARLRNHRVRWPHGTIRQEVELRIVQALVALGRHDEAERAASQFISQYPNNSHVNELRNLTASTNRDSPRESD